MTNFRLVSEYPVGARRLFDMVRKPAFQEAMALRFGAIEANATIVERSGNIEQMRIERSDPRRDLLGAFMPSRTESSVVLHDWNLDRLESRWSRHLLDRGKTVSVDGTVQVEVMGKDACRLVEAGQVTIRIPIIGRKLENKVIAELKKMLPARVDFIMRQLGCHE